MLIIKGSSHSMRLDAGRGDLPGEKPGDNGFSKAIFVLSISLLIGLSIIFMLAIPAGAYADDLVAQSLFVVMILLAGAMFAVEMAKSGLSAWAVFLFFMYCFYGVMPLLCFRSGYWLFGDISLDNRSGILHTGFLALLFLGCVIMGRRIAVKYTGTAFGKFIGYISARTFSRELVGLLPLVQITVIVFVAMTLGFGALMFRSGSGDSVNFESFWVVVIYNFVRPLSFFPFCFYIVFCRGRWDMAKICMAVLIGGLAFAGNNPTSIPRFYLFMMIAVFLYSFFYGTKFWRITSLGFLFVGFFGGIVTDQFRHVNNVSDFSTVSVDMGSYLTAGHFDAFEVNVYAIRYTEEYGYKKGFQALGVLGFWVPRMVWPDKPIPTGALLGGEFIGGLVSTKNTNLSCPLPAEGYIDFGFLGVVLYGILSGGFIGVLDKMIKNIWERMSARRSSPNGLIFINVVLPVLVGMTLFMSRGSLMPAFAYTLGSFCSALTLYFIFTRKTAV